MAAPGIPVCAVAQRCHLPISPRSAPLDHVRPCQAFPPLLRNSRLTPVGPRQLSADRTRRVGVVPKVDSPQTASRKSLTSWNAHKAASKLATTYPDPAISGGSFSRKLPAATSAISGCRGCSFLRCNRGFHWGPTLLHGQGPGSSHTRRVQSTHTPKCTAGWRGSVGWNRSTASPTPPSHPGRDLRSGSAPGPVA